MNKKILVALLPAALGGPSIANAAAPGGFELEGDIRGGYFHLDRDDRNGVESTTSDWRLRVRAGVLWQATEALSAKARFAGRYTTDDSNDMHYEFFTSIPAEDGLRFGDQTLDELYGRYKAGAWDVKLGRMQTKFELEGVAKKSLSRNDSPNMDITWTDGVHATYKDATGWNYHLILQRSEDDGPTTVRRSPLAFTEGPSHVTYYFGMEKIDKKGLFLQRGWDVTIIPSSLRAEGTATGEIKDYAAVDGRLALQWPLNSGMRFVWAGEVGYAFTTPENSAVKTPGSGDTGGLAFQTSVNLIDFVPSHSIGIVYGRVEGGWLLSPDFSNNQEMLEARYKWAIAKAHTFEARIRNRSDLEQRTGTVQKRDDVDYYLRYTFKF